MADYRIVCTIQQPASQPPEHAQIVSVGVGASPDHYTTRFLLQEVITMMDRGDRFYTVGPQSGKRASVEKYLCAYCHQYHIRSTGDVAQDNNLDNLPRCQV